MAFVRRLSPSQARQQRGIVSDLQSSRAGAQGPGDMRDAILQVFVTAWDQLGHTLLAGRFPSIINYWSDDRHLGAVGLDRFLTLLFV